MPVPLISAPAAGSLLKTVAGRFKTPAHKRAAKEVQTLLPRALAGDPTAIARLQQGSQFAATSKAKAVFKAALDRVRAAGVVASQMGAPLPAPLPLEAQQLPGAEPQPAPADKDGATKGMPWGLILVVVIALFLLKG